MFWKFRYRDCFGCTKQAELNSLRAAAKRFEDGTEAKRIIGDNRDVLEKCAQLLLEKEKITRAEFEALFDTKEGPALSAPAGAVPEAAAPSWAPDETLILPLPHDCAL